MHKPEITASLIKRVKKNKNLKVILPKDNELFLDIDTKEDWKNFQKRIIAFERYFGKNYKYTTETSISGYPHCHIIITLPFKVNDMQRIALQAALGSNASRELMSIYKMLNGDIKNSTLFIQVIDD